MNGKMSIEEWNRTVTINNTDSYNLAVCLAALLVAEHPDEDPHRLLCRHMSGLSGFQEDCALRIAAKLPIDELRHDG